VILTGNDGVIDRVRAKLAGSSEFMAKPPEPSKVLQVVERFLGSPAPAEKVTA
jgi:two-component system, chemotaxis family, response regulator PixG